MCIYIYIYIYPYIYIYTLYIYIHLERERERERERDSMKDMSFFPRRTWRCATQGFVCMLMPVSVPAFR